MLLIHQTGAVKVGEVVRYTVTYTPSLDRILPPPTHLHVKIKNTVAAPLRAAYLHGPYTLYVACYPSTFDPFRKHETVHTEGAPAFEPQLKAGGHWTAKLTVPEEVREDAQRYSTDNRLKGGGARKSFTWIIEVASQIIFSKTASVEYELLVGRDERSVDLGFHGVIGSGQGAPGKLEDHQKGRSKSTPAHHRGVFSKAIRLVVDDTESLWNTPPFPEWETDDEGQSHVAIEQGPQYGDKRDAGAKPEKKQKTQKKIHLVLLTHGIHSNVGADMLFMKESIDSAARQAKEDAKKRREESRARRMARDNDFGRIAVDQRSKSVPDTAILGDTGGNTPGPSTSTEDDKEEDAEEEDEEEVYVRGFTGNTVKTEKGIQYLGKRFAKYVLSITYPDQPYLPVKSSMNKSLSKSLSAPMSKTPGPRDHGSTQPAHKNSSIIKDENHRSHNLPYRITSISFIAHSLGGLIQTYAIAYIQKHSPEFFDLIKPINFVAMASPFLGLSNENPVYVKFALDFGLVGRTGQDLGLTWRAPTLAKSGWGAMVAGFTNEANKKSPDKDSDPAAKPLLRILPTGPAHVALKKFRNRTVYSNVVNDGIVPLRTSCLLFLDWRGLGRVEKARRESGLVGTMVGWGWAEMLGHNASDSRKTLTWQNLFSDSGDDVGKSGKSPSDPESKVPQAETSEGFDHDQRASEPEDNQSLEKNESPVAGRTDVQSSAGATSAPNLWTEVLNFFRPHAGRQKTPPGSPSRSPRRTQKIYRRGQIMSYQQGESESEEPSRENSQDGGTSSAAGKALVRGASLFGNDSRDDGNAEVEAPPKTTFFESAGDLLNPPLPPKDFILDPAARPRTIFHDRVYHPGDIPPPPAKRQRTFGIRRSTSNLAAQAASSSQLSPSWASSEFARPASANHSTPPSQVKSDHGQSQTQDVGTMKIEEKIARAYHKDLSWRKVLVRLEPDAHNNLVVRRMFANAYGWPVVRHLCDTHFAYTAAARTRDEDEENVERAIAQEEPITGGERGGESVRGQRELPEEKEEGHAIDSNRANTTDNIRIEESSPQEVEALQTDFQKLSTKWNMHESPRAATAGRTKRTDSEAREARDDVSELVSRVSATGESYSSMNSSRAALSRLARQDSARWSDRFFEGSDDGDEDEDEDGLLQEIRKARYRGELNRKFNIDFDVESAASDSESGRTPVEKISNGPLTKSPNSTKLSKPKDKGKGKESEEHMITESDMPLSAEPAELEPLSHSSAGTNTPRHNASSDVEVGPELEPGSITAPGTAAALGLSLNEKIDETRKPQARSGSAGNAGGVAEQVALATTRSRDSQDDDS
ncbi:putative serine esterase family protein [Cladophialophora carrionii]|uniref:Putative serine esterase family protein n=1 Tax=Cladophialophora carrionii TaxID=86049 RepID=A0A1C1CR53_9EURO|nr:putative serine esterase family protein [Cladophialophora carrionii]